MRYGIFSDIHSNLEAFDAVIAAYKDEAIDKYLCLGDIVGYAANPNECVEKIMALDVLSVAGNHDWASAGLFSLDYFNQIAKDALIWSRDNLALENRGFLGSLKLSHENDDLTLVHGTLHEPQEFYYMIDEHDAFATFDLLKTGVCFIGHTHTAEIFVKDKKGMLHYRKDNFVKLDKADKYIINVGSVGQPRDGNPDAAYCIYDTDKKEVCIKRVKYNIDAARKKIIIAGMPRFLADRLLVGK